MAQITMETPMRFSDPPVAQQLFGSVRGSKAEYSVAKRQLRNRLTALDKLSVSRSILLGLMSGTW